MSGLQRATLSVYGPRPHVESAGFGARLVGVAEQAIRPAVTIRKNSYVKPPVEKWSCPQQQAGRSGLIWAIRIAFSGIVNRCYLPVGWAGRTEVDLHRVESAPSHQRISRHGPAHLRNGSF